jgi:hypothetical protein
MLTQPRSAKARSILLSNDGDTLPTLRGCQIHGTHDGGLAIWLNLSEEQGNRPVAKDTPRATTDASRPIDLTSGPYDGKVIGS